MMLLPDGTYAPLGGEGAESTWSFTLPDGQH